MEKTRILKLTTTFMAMLAVIMSSFAMFPQASDAANNKNKPTEVNQMLTLINEFRVKSGLQKVKVNTTLTTTAGNWAGYLAYTKDYDKYSDFVTKAPAGWSSPGEIKGSTSPGSVNYLFEEWAKSPAHANVIKNPAANIVGIGLAYDNSGTLHGTLNFFNYAKAPAGTYTTFPGGTTTPTKPKQVFTDVNSSVIFKKEIETLASKNVTKGWKMSNGTSQYRPYEDVKRDAMIVFIYRAMGSPAYTPPKKSPFSDVSTSNVFYKEIAWAYSKGITQGWKMKDGTRQFRPFEPVKRDAVAAFLMRASGEKAPSAKSAPFSDVPKSTIFVDEIAWMKKTGISTGWKHNNTYQPYANTKRDAMAAFVVRWMDHTGYKGTK